LRGGGTDAGETGGGAGKAGIVTHIGKLVRVTAGLTDTGANLQKVAIGTGGADHSEGRVAVGAVPAVERNSAELAGTGSVVSEVTTWAN
jgi:hypothetical protein